MFSTIMASVRFSHFRGAGALGGNRLRHSRHRLLVSSRICSTSSRSHCHATGFSFEASDALPDQARVTHRRGQVIRLDVIGSEQLVKQPLFEVLLQFSRGTEDHTEVRSALALGLLARPPAFRLSWFWLHFSAVVFDQRLE
jgi:hypothetical protein